MRDVGGIILAFGGIVAVVLVVTNFHVAVIVFGSAALGMVIAGQAISMQEFYLALIPPVQQALVAELFPGLVPQPYSQAVLFRAKVRALPGLLLTALFSIAYAVVFVSDVWRHWSWRPSSWQLPLLVLWYVWALVTASAVIAGWRWLSERMLLHRGAVTWGVIGSTWQESVLSYWFFNADRERCGGTARHYPWHIITSPLTPIFVNSRKADFNKPGFSFVFHQFAVADIHHAPHGKLFPPQQPLDN
jgi:hypothetical protein